MIEYGNANDESVAIFSEPSITQKIKMNSVVKTDYDSYLTTSPKVGDKLTCSLITDKSKNRELLFDANLKTNIIVNANSEELTTLSKYDDMNNITVYVTEIKDNPYNIYGSLRQSKYNSIKSLISLVVDTDYALDVYVDNMTPSGYNLVFEYEDSKYSAFMPHTLAGANKIIDSERILLVDTNIKVHIESYSVDNGTFVASRKSYLESMIPSLLNSLVIMEKVYTGRVTGTTDFGVFVEFDGLTGMVHKTSIREDMRENLTDIKPGTEIDFYVKEIIKGRPVLTQYQNDYSLWDTIKIGDVYDATVKAIINYGILVSIDNEINGVIYKKDMRMDSDKYHQALKCKVKVVLVDKNTRKIYLTDRI